MEEGEQSIARNYFRTGMSSWVRLVKMNKRSRVHPANHLYPGEVRCILFHVDAIVLNLYGFKGIAFENSKTNEKAQRLIDISV